MCKLTGDLTEAPLCEYSRHFMGGHESAWLDHAQEEGKDLTKRFCHGQTR